MPESTIICEWNIKVPCTSVARKVLRWMLKTNLCISHTISESLYGSCLPCIHVFHWWTKASRQWAGSILKSPKRSTAWITIPFALVVDGSSDFFQIAGFGWTSSLSSNGVCLRDPFFLPITQIICRTKSNINPSSLQTMPNYMLSSKNWTSCISHFERFSNGLLPQLKVHWQRIDLVTDFSIFTGKFDLPANLFFEQPSKPRLPSHDSRTHVESITPLLRWNRWPGDIVVANSAVLEDQEEIWATVYAFYSNKQAEWWWIF